MYGIPVTVGRETVTIALRTVPGIPSIEQVVTRDPDRLVASVRTIYLQNGKTHARLTKHTQG